MEMSREYWAQAERGQRFLRMRVGDGGEGAQALWLPVALTSSCREGGGGGSDTLPAAQQPWLAEVVASEAAAAAATAAAATATATAAAAAAASEADEGAPTANPILFTRPGITGTALSQHTYSDRVSTLYYVRCGCVIRAFGDC